MFRTLYGGASEAAFHLELEYGLPDGAPLAQPGVTHLQPPPPPPPRLEFDWSQSDDPAAAAARLTRAAAALVAAHARTRVRVALSVGPPPDAAPAGAGGAIVSASQWQEVAGGGAPPAPRVLLRLSYENEAPVLRGLAFTRTSGSGAASEALVAALLRALDTTTARRLKLCDGLGWAAAVWAVEPRAWAALRGLSLSGCGLASLPPAVGTLSRIKVLRLSNNKLTSLPAEIGRLSELELLAADNNQLTAVPADLHHCTRLVELDLSSNRIAKLLFDLRSLGRLQSLQLYGNPLEYLPELTPATALRSLSLANVRILSDSTFSRFEVELSAPASTSYSAIVLGVGPHKLTPLFGLIFKRSTIQHPLLAGALARLCEDPANLELLAREDVALQQLVAMAISDDERVMRHACAMLSALGAVPGASGRLVRANAIRAVCGLVGAGDKAFQIAGLEVLASLARGASDHGDRLLPPALLSRILDLARAPPRGSPRVRCACLDALCALAFDDGNRRRLLQSAALMALLTELAAPPPAGGGVGSYGHEVGGGAGGGSGEGAGGGSSAGAPCAAGAGAAQLSSALGRRARGGPDCVSLVAASVAGGGAGAGAAGGGGGGAAAAEPPADAAAGSPSSGHQGRRSGASSPSPLAGSPAAPPAAASPLERSPSPPAAATAPRTRNGGRGSSSGDGSPGALDRAAVASAPSSLLEAAKWDPRLHAIRLLAVMGQNEQVRIALGRPPIGRLGRGVRVLAMDGGGMKGMAMVELLRQIERRAGRPIWQLFDVICGTSTGALLAVALGMLRLSLDACNDIYTMLGRKVFNQSTVVAEDAGWKESLYKLYATGSHSVRFAVYGFKHDAAPYEELLRDYCRLTPLGCIGDSMIDSAVLGGPYVFATATLASAKPASPFVFRNYELPFEAAPLAAGLRACSGSSRYDVWQAVRASSAAPYYLDDFTCGDSRFQDGATTANNPAVVALQQARLLHPDVPVDCLVSLGCGQGPPEARGRSVHSMMDTGALLVEAACSVDRVNEALSTVLPLVPGFNYFRFCAEDPRCSMPLDDISPESWRKLLAATTEYCGRPEVAARFDELGTLLGGGGGGAAAAGIAVGAGVEGGGAAAEGQEQEAAEGVPGAWLPPRGPSPAGGSAAPGSPARSSSAAPGLASPARGAAAAPRLGTARGVLLVEAPRSAFPEAATHVEAAAEAAAALPQLLRRCNLGAAAGRGGGEDEAAEAVAALDTVAGAGVQQEYSFIHYHNAHHHHHHQQQQAAAQDSMVSPQSQHMVPWPQLGAVRTAAVSIGGGGGGGGGAGAPTDHHLPPRSPRGSLSPAPPRQHESPSRSGARAGGKQQQQQRSEQQQQDGAGAGALSPSPSSSWLSMLPFLSGGGGRKDATPPASEQMDDQPQRSSPGPRGSSSGGAAEPAGASGRAAAAAPHGSPAAAPHEALWEAHQAARRRAAAGAGAAEAAPAAERLVGALCGALRASAGALGVVHLALHALPGGALAGGWRSRVFAVAEPGPDADRLAGEWSAAVGDAPGAPLSRLLAGRASLELPGGGVLCVLGQQQVRTLQGRLVTSWMFQVTEPDPDALLDAAQLLPLAAAMPRAVLVSSGPLPGALVRPLLRAGARAVVAAADGRGSAWRARDVGGFFSELYSQLLVSGTTVPEALAAAEAVWPALRGAFACHHL